jgi:hypothetical protein
VLFSIQRALAVLALSSLAAVSLWAQQATTWKDRAEYDLYDSITKEQNPQTRLGLLDSWKAKYPDSKESERRLQAYLTTYQALGRGKDMFAAAKELVAVNPKNFTGLYWLNLFTLSNNDKSPEALALGEKAGNGLLGVLDETFDSSKKAATVSDEDWKKEKDKMAAIGHKTLGWVAMQKDQNEPAEKEFLEALKANPDDAQASYFAGTVVLKQRKLEKQSAGIYHLVRAANYDGPGALPEATRTQLKAFVEKAYVNFHGDKAGLDQVIAEAKKSALPDPSFKIESKDEILAKEEAQLEKSNPQLALWIRIKRELSGPNGAAYFDGTLKNSQIPGGVEVGGTKIMKLKGKVVSTKPAKPKGIAEIVLGISSDQMSEVTLRFPTPVNATVAPGTELEFEGVPVEFVADPFNLVFETEAAKVDGLPKAAAPAVPAHKPPAKK